MGAGEAAELIERTAGRLRSCLDQRVGLRSDREDKAFEHGVRSRTRILRGGGKEHLGAQAVTSQQPVVGSPAGQLDAPRRCLGRECRHEVLGIVEHRTALVPARRQWAGGEDRIGEDELVARGPRLVDHRQQRRPATADVTRGDQRGRCSQPRGQSS